MYLGRFKSYKDILLGKFSLTMKILKKMAMAVHSVNPTADRSIKDVRKRYENMVQDAKKEMFKGRNLIAGGQPQQINK